MAKTATEKLGFYFCLFQSQTALKRSYIKVWVDGSDYATHLSEDDFIGLVKANATDLLPNFRKAIRETSYFLWDVSEVKLKRVHAQFELEPYKEMIKNKEQEEKETESIWERFWKRDYTDVDKDPKIQTGE